MFPQHNQLASTQDTREHNTRLSTVIHCIYLRTVPNSAAPSLNEVQKPFVLDFGEYNNKVVAVPFRVNSMFNRLRIEQYVSTQFPGVLLVDDDVLLSEALLECMSDHLWYLLLTLPLRAAPKSH